MESEKEELIEDEKQLKELEEAKYTSKITAKRGRLIRKLKSLKKRIEKKGEMTPEVNELLNKIDSDLSEQILKHKSQLKIRYNEEFLQAEAKVPDVLTTLPKGIGLQFKRVLNCINEVKQSKTKKAKALGMMNVGKQLGLLLATPVIFAGKFIVEHWYLLLLLLQFDKIDDLKNFFKKQKNSNNQEINQQHQEVPVESAEKVSVKKPLLNPKVKQYEKPYVNIPVNNMTESVKAFSVVDMLKNAGYNTESHALLDGVTDFLNGNNNGLVFFKDEQDAAKTLFPNLTYEEASKKLMSSNNKPIFLIGNNGLFNSVEKFLEFAYSSYENENDFMNCAKNLANINSSPKKHGNIGNVGSGNNMVTTYGGLAALSLLASAIFGAPGKNYSGGGMGINFLK